MKRLSYFILCTAALSVAAMPGYAADNAKIGVVSFKTCLEQSKVGKQEQANFDAIKKQMETVLEEKGKALEAIELKKRDADYLDSLSPEMETEFNRKARALEGEFMQLQNQYMQTLNQANVKILQKLNDLITEASKEIAPANKLDLVINDEACYFCSPSLDISSEIAKKMDELAEKQNKAEKQSAK
jgi:outer membrane protein